MSALIDILRVVLIVNAILMAWPFYALVAVNQRARSRRNPLRSPG